jgi:HNH endonuclease
MVSGVLRELVAQRAGYVCEYCHSPEFVSADRFTVDHILPQSLGGLDKLDNLALACRRCNERRSNFTIGIDPETQQEIPLFNPRQQQWSEHFAWTANGLRIEGITATGRATCQRLDINDEFRLTPFIQTSRQIWMRLGLHPPDADARSPE